VSIVQCIPKPFWSVAATRLFKSAAHGLARSISCSEIQSTRGGVSRGRRSRLLEAAPRIKYKAALGVSYLADLRVRVATLSVSDIDGKRVTLRVT
jgi:hypothetical protein